MSIEWTFNCFNMRDKCLKSTVLWLFFISFNSFNIGYFIQPCNIACGMHFRPLWHTLDLAKLAFSAYQFLAGSFLIFPIIYLTVDLKLICIIGLSDLINPLISADSCPGWHNYSLWELLFHFHGQLALKLWELLFHFHGQLALKFHWVKTCLYFELLSTLSILHLNRSVMPKPVYLLTVQEAHKEYNSLTDQIRAKYE